MCIVHRDVHLYVEPYTCSEVCIHGCVSVGVCHCACGSVDVNVEDVDLCVCGCLGVYGSEWECYTSTYVICGYV